jgi:hypothetical protein
MKHRPYEPVEGGASMFAPDPFDSVRAHGFGIAFSCTDILFLRGLEEDTELAERSDREKIECILRGYGGAGL